MMATMLLEFYRHGLERDRLIRLDVADHEAGILRGEKSLGHDLVQIDVQSDGAEEDHQHHAVVPERPGQAAIIAVQQSCVGALAPCRECARACDRRVA